MKVPRPVLILSLLLEIVGLILLLTGMLTPQLQDTDDPVDFNLGLYYSCVDDDCDEFDPFPDHHEFEVTRALISLALVLDVVAFLLSMVTMGRAQNIAALPDTEGRVAPGPGNFPRILLVLGIVAAALSTAGLIIFHVEFEPEEPTEYGYSFYLIIAGTCVFFVGVVMLFLYILKATHVSRDKVAGFETDSSKSEDGLEDWSPYVIPRKNHGNHRSRIIKDHRPVQLYPGMDPRDSVRSMPGPWALKAYPEQYPRGYYPAHKVDDVKGFRYEHRNPHLRVEPYPSYVNANAVGHYTVDPYQSRRYYNSLNLRRSQYSPRADMRPSNSHKRQSGENSYTRQSGENSYKHQSNSYKRQSGENSYKRQSGKNSYRGQYGENGVKRQSGERPAYIHTHKPRTTNMHNGMSRGQGYSAQPRGKDPTKMESPVERFDIERATRQGFMLY